MSSAQVPLDTGTAPAQPVVQLLKAHEAAAILGCGPHAVTQLCRDGALRAYRPMKAWLIHPDDLQAFIAAHSNDQQASA